MISAIEQQITENETTQNPIKYNKKLKKGLSKVNKSQKIKKNQAMHGRNRSSTIPKNTRNPPEKEESNSSSSGSVSSQTDDV